MLQTTVRPSLHQAIFEKKHELECDKEPNLFHGPGHMMQCKKIHRTWLASYLRPALSAGTFMSASSS